MVGLKYFLILVTCQISWKTLFILVLLSITLVGWIFVAHRRACLHRRGVVCALTFKNPSTFTEGFKSSVAIFFLSFHFTFFTWWSTLNRTSSWRLWATCVVQQCAYFNLCSKHGSNLEGYTWRNEYSLAILCLQSMNKFVLFVLLIFSYSAW